MLVVAVLSIVISIILFHIIKIAFEAHNNGEIVIYYDGWDLAFNCVAYLIPLALIFCVDKNLMSQVNQVLFYALTCIGFTILMGISAYQCNSNSIGKFLIALFIKICIGIETIAVLIASVVLLILLIALSADNQKTRRRRA